MRLFIMFSLLVVLGVSCSYSKHSTMHLPSYLIALNEDSISTHQITLLKNYNFYYAIIKKTEVGKQVESFKGTYRLAVDSILLSYDKTVYSPETEDYLIWDNSKSYLIQNFRNNKPIKLMEIQKSN